MKGSYNRGIQDIIEMQNRGGEVTIRLENPEETAARKAKEAANPGYCDWATEVFIVETLIPRELLPISLRPDLH